MATNRTVPPPRPPRGGTVRGQQAPAPVEEQPFTLGETSERRVERTADRSAVPTPPDVPRNQRSSVSRGGIRLADLAGDDGDIEEAAKGYGPAVVILHDAVTGPGSARTGAFERGKVIRLSQLLGDEIMKGLERGEPSARAALRRYLLARDESAGPAIREASEQEAQYDEISFAEGEDELEDALNASEESVRARDAENKRLRGIIEQLRNDPEADVQTILAQLDDADTTGGLAMGRRGSSGSPESRMNPNDPTPSKTGETAGGRNRDTGFLKQGQEAIKDSASPGDQPGPGTEIQGAASGQETDEFDEAFTGPEGEDGGETVE